MSTFLIDDMLLLGSTREGRHALRDLPTLVAGAALADLAGAGRIDCPGRTVEVLDPTGVGHPVLDDLLTRIATRHRGHTPWRWIFDSARRVVRDERDHLVQVGVLGTEEDTVLGMVPRVRHPVRDTARQDAVVERVRDVVLAHDVHAAVEADPRTGLLVALLGTAFHSRRTGDALFPELDPRSLRTRLRAVGRSHWTVTATARAVTLTNAARA